MEVPAQTDRSLMEQRNLGRTGLLATRLGLGLAALGRPGYINLGHAADLGDYDPAVMEAHAHAVLDAAWQAGVRYFDVARSYGNGERFLASWLGARGVAPADVVVASKWGYTYTAGWRVHAEHHEVKDHSLATLRRQFAESRALLGPWLKLSQIHSATLESGVLDDAAVLGELAGLRGQGWRVGLTLSGPRQADTLRRALAVTIDGVGVFDCVQATWNLLEPSAGPALAEAHAAGLGVIVKEALANGRLTGRNREPDFEWRRLLLERAAGQLGTSLDALALAAVLAQPWADVVLSGAATAEQFHANVQALAVRYDEETAAALAALAEPAETYWRVRGKLAWN
jgi:aryl-alcohol dehydrogenase-like predicted oxidoreductase